MKVLAGGQQCPATWWSDERDKRQNRKKKQNSDNIFFPLVKDSIFYLINDFLICSFLPKWKRLYTNTNFLKIVIN